jgi:hypothetical protein
MVEHASAVLPSIGTESGRDHRKHHAKPNTRHEVTSKIE